VSTTAPIKQHHKNNEKIIQIYQRKEHTKSIQIYQSKEHTKSINTKNIQNPIAQKKKVTTPPGEP
jgi:hypothetical protein